MCFFKKINSITRIAIALFVLILMASCSSSNRTEQRLSFADSVTVRMLIRKSDEVRFSHPDSALRLLSRVNDIYRRYGDANGTIDYFSYAQYLYSDILNDTLSSRKCMDSIRHIASLPGNEHLQYRAQGALGDYYFAVKKDYPEAVVHYLEALRIQPKTTDSIFFLNAHGSLAQIYFEQGNMKEASDYYEPLLKRVAARPDAPEKVVVYINGYCFADTHTAVGRERKRKYILAAKQIGEKFHDATVNNLLYTNLANYYNNIGLEDSCLFYAQKAIAADTGNKTGLLSSALPALEIMGNYYARRNNFDSVRKILARIEANGDVASFGDNDFEGQYYDLKYRLYKHEGNTGAALAMLEKRSEIEARIFAIKKQKELLEHDRALKKLDTKRIISEKNSELERHRLYTIGLIICAVLLALLVIMVYLYWRNQRKLEAEKWMDIQRRKEYESQKRLLEERSRIAGEMHDDLGSTLTSTMMAVELIKMQPGEAAPLAMIDRSANQLSDQINEIIWNMNVKNDNLESLDDYILRFASNFLKDASIDFSWTEDLDEKNIPVSGQERRNIFLCVKELINNIVKHANAVKVQLDIRHSNGILTIDIRDNGTGMEGSNVATAGSGNGLLNIKKRIADMNGQVSWLPLQPGTHVHISVPLPQ